jgi:hypothetical protein
MTFGAPDAQGPPLRAVVGLLIAAFGLAACITLVWLGMRGVMNVGGACADGGPYVSAQPCPDGVALLMTLGIFGLFGFGGLGFWAGSIVGGGWIGLPLLAWPGLFLSLGWNFLEYGANPPEPFGDGPELGWLIPGLLFVLMGGVPLLVAWRARDVIRSEGQSAVSTPFGNPTFGSIRAAGRRAAPPPDMTPSATPRGVQESADIVDGLERLARLRRSGDITNAEFESAKAALLRQAGKAS